MSRETFKINIFYYKRVLHDDLGDLAGGDALTDEYLFGKADLDFQFAWEVLGLNSLPPKSAMVATDPDGRLRVTVYVNCTDSTFHKLKKKLDRSPKLRHVNGLAGITYSKAPGDTDSPAHILSEPKKRTLPQDDGPRKRINMHPGSSSSAEPMDPCEPPVNPISSLGSQEEAKLSIDTSTAPCDSHTPPSPLSTNSLPMQAFTSNTPSRSPPLFSPSLIDSRSRTMTPLLTPIEIRNIDLPCTKETRITCQEWNVKFENDLLEYPTYEPMMEGHEALVPSLSTPFEEKTTAHKVALQRKEKMIRDLGDTLRARLDEVKFLRTDLQRVKDKRRSLEKELRYKDSEVKNYKAKVGRRESFISKIEGESKQKDHHIQTLKKQLRESQLAEDMLVARLAAKDESLQELRVEVDSLHEEKQNQKDDLIQLLAILVGGGEIMEGIKRENESLTSERNTLSHQLGVLQEIVQALQQDKNSLIRELDKRTEDLQRNSDIYSQEIEQERLQKDEALKREAMLQDVIVELTAERGQQLVKYRELEDHLTKQNQRLVAENCVLNEQLTGTREGIKALLHC